MLNLKKHTFYNYAKIFMLLIVFYIGVMTIAYIIPNKFIDKNVNQSIKILDKEKIENKTFFNNFGSTLDNFTDNLMFQKTLKANGFNPIKAGIDVNGYFRYWHGYQAFLRPSLIFFNLISIRYLNLFIFFMILTTVIILLKDKLGFLYSLSFVMCFTFTYFFVIPMSLQYMSVFMIMLISSAIILKFYENDRFKNKMGYLFFVIGSITNFMDLLTAPLVTLGIPLIILILLRLENEENYSSKKSIMIVIKECISWGCGYLLTWVSKWIIATTILNVNAFEDAFKAILFRTEGNANSPISYVVMFGRNIITMFPLNVIKFFVVPLFIIGLFFIIRKKKFEEVLKVVPILIVSICPYVWYFILGNHSQIHFWFTYRIQLISVFGIASSFIYCLKSKRVSINK